MAILRFNNLAVSEWIVSGSMASANVGRMGQQIAASANTTVNPPGSFVFGTGNSNASADLGVAHLFLFKGTIPTDFTSSFTSMQTRDSDLLHIMQIGRPSAVTITAQSDGRSLVGQSYPGSRAIALSGNIVRSTDVVTVTTTTSTSTVFGARIPYPGQSITIAGISDASFNGTFTVASTPTANTFTFNQSGSNATVAVGSGTVTIPYTAIANGVASWFCIARTGNTWIPSTPFTDFGAIIGTVGAIGSGADLEIISTTITAGSTYASAGFYLNFASSWTVP